MAVRANALNGSDWLKNSFSIWRDFARNGDRKSHPASFPVSLVQKILDCYAREPNSLILDPFAGSGSTMLAASQANMRSVGLDINENYRNVFLDGLDLFDVAQNSGANEMWRYEICDARKRSDFFNVVQSESVDVCVTSPPYWDILNRRRSSDGKKAIPYSDSDSDIGNISSYEDFLHALGDVIENIGIAVKDRCYFILNVMDLRKGKFFYPLHQDAATIVKQRTSFVLGDTPSKDRIISRIKPSYYVRFEFGYSAAFFDRSMKFDGFSSGFTAVYDTSQGPFSLFDEQPGQIVKSTRVGRSAAFRQIILQAYGNQCCVCNDSLVDLFGFYETEAAHVVPKSHNGSDDARNGIALCRKHHWAFDRGMFGIDDNYRVIVPDKTLSIEENASLRHHNGSLIQCPDENAMPHSSALDWHRNNILCES